MNIMELGAIGELVGGIAVIASLVYVGLQIRHNTRVNRAQVVTTRLAGQSAGEIALMGHDGAAALARAFDKPEELSTAEILQVYTYLTTALLAVLNSYETQELGLASRKEWEVARSQGAAYLAFPFGQDAMIRVLPSWPSASGFRS